MSATTSSALQNAQAEVSVKTSELRDRQDRLLAWIAQNLPAKVDELAKGVVLDQGSVSNSLGVEGVRLLLSELRAEAIVLASETMNAAEDIDWPQVQDSDPSEGEVETQERKVEWVLLRFFGDKASKLAQVFKSHGYDIDDDNFHNNQGLIEGSSLIESAPLSTHIDNVAVAQRQLHEAQKAMTVAQENEDRAQAKLLWDAAK